MFHLFYSQTPKLIIWMPAHVFSCRDPRLRLLAGCQPPPAVWPKTTARIQSFSLPHPCSRTTEFLCVFYTTTFFLLLFLLLLLVSFVRSQHGSPGSTGFAVRQGFHPSWFYSSHIFPFSCILRVLPSFAVPLRWIPPPILGRFSQ